MKKAKVLEKKVISPENFIGTKWTACDKMFCERMMLEFVDNKNCIYTSKPKKYSLTYTVTGGKMFISHVEGPFALKGDVLFNSGFPTFKKVS